MSIASILFLLSFQLVPASEAPGVYSAILREVRTEHPGRSVVLSETRSDVECLPHCSPDGERERHPVDLVQNLREPSLVQATCFVPASTLGCERPRPGHVLVALSGVHPHPAPSQPGSEPTVSVMVVTYVPCQQACRSPDASGYRFVLQKQGGEWRVVKKLPVWIV